MNATVANLPTGQRGRALALALLVALLLILWLVLVSPLAGILRRSYRHAVGPAAESRAYGARWPTRCRR